MFGSWDGFFENVYMQGTPNPSPGTSNLLVISQGIFSLTSEKKTLSSLPQKHELGKTVW